MNESSLKVGMIYSNASSKHRRITNFDFINNNLYIYYEIVSEQLENGEICVMKVSKCNRDTFLKWALFTIDPTSFKQLRRVNKM